MFNYVDRGYYSVLITAFAWSITEVIRFTFYSLKIMNIKRKENVFAELFGFLRYTTFIILYPIGISGEMITFHKVFYPNWPFFFLCLVYVIFFP